VVVDQAACVGCLGCEMACANAFYKELNPEVSCIRIEEEEDGSLKTLVCVQCGKCAEACPFGVLVKSEDKDVPSKCIACGICVDACPQNVLAIEES